ncbi:hypothetical protein [Staphylococcus hominis]|uniref:hypothetical protein n=1 Tax=Staphylococcus hominis TaxID=1290 RepID=UPI00287A377C|nr:hypothetical protein [Staphylococcus hominis]MDS3898443.1 hypothetical protein [Staphylococcus hominis]
MANIYIAKLNVNEKIYEVYKNEIQLSKLLKNLYYNLDDKKILENEFNEVRYKIVDIEKDPENFIISGRFLRIFKSQTQDFYDSDKDTVVEKALGDKAEYVPFTFYVKREIIAFVPKQTFTRKQFLKIFKEFITYSYPEIGEVDLQIKYDNASIDKKFKKIKVLKKVDVVIVPPNGDEDLWEGLKNVEKDLKETEAKKMSFSLEATKKKPLKKTSNLVQGFLKFVKNQYGELEAIGYDAKNNEVNIDTINDEKLIEKYKISESEKNSPNEIRETLKESNVV